MSTDQPVPPATEQRSSRKYICPQLLRIVKLGETWSLDRTCGCYKLPQENTIVEFDGYGLDGCWRWKHEATGRVFIYTQEQCCRMIYKLVPNATEKAGVA